MHSSATPTNKDLAGRVAAVRRFNRFYTRRIGALQEGVLRTPFSLTEGRVLYELAHREGCTASELARDLGLDPGYLSRILRGFEGRGLLARAGSEADARIVHLALTEAGREAFAPLHRRSDEEIGAMLGELPVAEQQRLLAAMARIEALLAGPAAGREPFVLRPHRVGDIGWIVHRQALLYAEEYAWDIRYEALIAGICATFVRDFDPARERCWIAEREGEILGSVFLVRNTDTQARLRLLYVEAHARGLGLGRRLVGECIQFARAAGYRSLTLWTCDILVSARKIYEAAGFRLVKESPYQNFGHDLVAQDWELDLTGPRPP
jgi:DNA-binding MarR family transcriptional regulator/GNAT superfamily N-acetyltransferase